MQQDFRSSTSSASTDETLAGPVPAAALSRRRASTPEIPDVVTIEHRAALRATARLRRRAVQHALCLRRRRGRDQHERRSRGHERSRAHDPRRRQGERRADTAERGRCPWRARALRNGLACSRGGRPGCGHGLPAAAASRRCAPPSTTSSPIASAMDAFRSSSASTAPRTCFTARSSSSGASGSTWISS